LISSIYNSFENHPPQDMMDALKKGIEKKLKPHDTIKLFFRADDIGVPSKKYEQMMALFLKYQTPLCLAVVPAWLTRVRWDVMADSLEKGNGLFCWHMHGYRHVNHETEGKNQEFGPARLSQAIYNDLSRGHNRLQSIMGKQLTKVFTPPWNRCSLETMEILKKIGFQGISRSHGNLPAAPDGLKEFPVHVDLHTRKEKQAEKGWEMLLAEFEQGVESRVCGIMLHHMRMNRQAFIFLEYILDFFSQHKQIKTITYDDLI